VSYEVVRIGLLLDMSGIYADSSGPGSIIAAKMAVTDFGGRVLGRPVEIVATDHQSRAGIASAISRKWFVSEKVDAIMDVVGSATALAAIEVAKSYSKIVVINGADALRIAQASW
jgi:branched-chain amino acid transport system substrate-binding protein